MAKVIVYETPGHQVRVIHPAPKGRKKDETESDWIDRLIERSAPKGITCHVMDESELPTSRRWRVAWRLRPNGKVEVDIEEARKIRRGEILRLRDRAFEALREQIDEAEDGNEMMKADELRRRRKKIRELVITLDGRLKDIATPEEISDFTPAELRVT